MNEQIKTNVRSYISAHANLPVSHFTDDTELKKQPLMLDDTGLVFLAKSLRDYVKSLNSSQTVVAEELKKSGLTVRGTYELIIKKIG